jgi:Zn-dependent M16 (insulinase) family peptidase
MRIMPTRKLLTFAACFVAMTLLAAPSVDLNKLTKGEVVNGFSVESVYLNDAEKPMGARFIHQKSHFTLDLLRIESVPQAFTYVNSFPVSDQGEPHTQEHLLVGKGKTGRSFAGLDTMWLAQSTAFTQQWRTSYPFNTNAGPDVFFNLFDAQLNALLNPDYTDEEIRREVRNFGVTENTDHTFRLEEKGSVYNEMTSSSNNPVRNLLRAADHLVYGTHHPLSYNAGGELDGIRTMKPSDIRSFHDSTYYLGNMGTVVALPPIVDIAATLSRVNATLNRLQGTGASRTPKTMKDLSSPDMAQEGTLVVVDYPNRNAQQPSPIALVWPATRDLDANDTLLIQLFFDNIASDATSNLYKTFIDSKTRTMDIGAKGIRNNVSLDQGYPIYVTLTDVTSPNLTKERLAEVRKAMTGEINRIAAFPDRSPELADFDKRIEGRVAELQRVLSKFVNSPPGFGFRGGGSAWFDQLFALEKTGSFRKSLTMKPQLAYVRQRLASRQNFWRTDLAKWRITGVEPYAVAAKASPDLLAKNESERAARSAAEAERLAAQYGVSNPQEAIRRYRTDYDAETVKIDRETAAAPASFVERPPMTIDDQLKFTTTKFNHDVAMVASTFENMAGVTAGIALRLDSVPAEDLRYLAVMPALLTGSGVIENGKPLSFEEMSERIRNEILSVNAAFSTNVRTGRAEIVVRGAGNDLTEAKRAIGWMRLVLEHPDWRVENLPRIRDAVDQALSQLRNTMQGAEESWVNNPADVYRRQDNALLMASSSFLTRSYNALRLSWMLKDVPAADHQAIKNYLTALAGAAKDASRTQLKASIAANGSSLPGYGQLSARAKSIASDALRDLDLALVDIPDASLAGDWAELVTEMRDDLLTPPVDVLAKLDSVRRNILHASNARMFLAASDTNQKALSEAIAGLANALDPTPIARAPVNNERKVDTRLRQRGAIVGSPVFVGLLAPNMSGGVVITSVAGVQYADVGNRDKQLDYLSSRLYAGPGAHGIFAKTIAAGFAYSNGLRGSIAGGRLGYYAERTPELPQTIRFVINELKNATRDLSLTDYAIAQAFGDSRAAATYESRAESMAADLADGQTPNQVRQFRESIRELRKDPKLGEMLFARMNRVVSTFLPGYDAGWKPLPGGAYFVIGPDKQLDAYEQYLKTFGGSLVRLYPRDFWM